MKEFIQYILYFHAFSGGIALLGGILAILTKKGSKNHTLSGEVYFYAMLSVVITGLIVATYRGNLFLQTIAIFSFYMAFTGKRVLRNKKEIVTSPLDWGFNIISMASGLFMLYLVIVNFARIGFAGAMPMLLVFGGLLTWMTVEDARKMWKKKWVKNYWLYTHIGRMGGSFIATSTAFLLTNIHFEPSWIFWLAPTVIGSPLIAAAIGKWKVKLGDRKKKEIAV
jgi:asparagine N-glycosylation enzyme membrane subunit Stt3